MYIILEAFFKGTLRHCVNESVDVCPCFIMSTPKKRREAGSCESAHPGLPVFILLLQIGPNGLQGFLWTHRQRIWQKEKKKINSVSTLQSHTTLQNKTTAVQFGAEYPD